MDGQNFIVDGFFHKLKMIEAVSENIKNANNIGYKRQIPETIKFQSVLESAKKDITPGDFKKTTGKLDFAIEGDASFLIDSKDGLEKTRIGKFHINEKGNITTKDGDEVVIIEKTDAPVNLTAELESIKVTTNGEIFVGGKKYGRFALDLADNKSVKIHQGVLEGSNVNILQEMATLSMTYRALESAEKAISLQASLDRDLVDKYGKNV